jgi:hypothetical protein
MQSDHLEIRDRYRHEGFVPLYLWRLILSIWVLGGVGQSILFEARSLILLVVVEGNLLEFDAF